MIAVLTGGEVRDQSFSMKALAYLQAAEDIEQAQRGGHGDAICCFGFLLPQGESHLSPDEWLQRGRIDSRTVTANSAGMLALAYYCTSYGGENECLEGSERDDLEKIHSLLLHLSSEARERSTIQDADGRFGALNLLWDQVKWTLKSAGCFL